MPILLIAAIFIGNSVRERVTADAVPTLPPRTPAEVADWAASPHPQPRSGFFELSTNLGLGDFGTATGESGGSFVGLAAGTNNARVWEDGTGRRRIAVLQPLQETDWYREGATTYVWHSDDVRVTKVNTPSVSADPSDGLITLLAGGGTVETPDGLATRLLPLRAASTRLVLHEPGHVAGRPVYQLGMIPDSSASLVKEIAVSVDARTGLPLRVAVQTRSGTVAIRAEFKSLALRRPAASHFTFRPPSEARVVDGQTVATSPDVFSGDWRKERERENAMQDVQSVSGVNQSLVRLATRGTSWDEVVVLSGFRPWRLEQLTRSAETVTGAFGTGQLVRTPVFSVLTLPSGQIIGGAVTPQLLEAVAAQGARTR